MRRQNRHACIALCVTVMVAGALAAVVWWRPSWIALVLLVAGLACVAAMLYAWMTQRRIERLLEGEGNGPADAVDPHAAASASRGRRMNHVS